MIVRTRNEPISTHVNHMWERLMNPHRKWGIDLRRELDMSAVVETFWPATTGWVPLAAEPGRTRILFLFAHPHLGIAATLMCATAEDTGIPVTMSDWANLSGQRRCDYFGMSHHAHGETRLDLLEAIAASKGPVPSLRAHVEDRHPSDLLMTVRLIDSPTFMDDTTQMMVGLGACRELIAEARAHQVRVRAARLDTTRAHTVAGSP